MFVAIRDGMLSHTGIPDPFEALKALGLSSVEVAIDREMNVGAFRKDAGTPHSLASLDDAMAFKELLSRQGVTVCGLLMANDFSNDDRQAEVQWLKKACEAANALGAPVVRIDLIPRTQMDDDSFIKRSAEIICEALSLTSEVELGIENHGNTSNREDFLEKIFEAVDSERVGLTLDSGNFYWWGHPLDDVYRIMERFSDRVKHTHIKNIKFPPETRNVQREIGWKYGEYVSPIYEGDVDHARVVSILKKAGYDRGLTIEDESLGKFTPQQFLDVLKKDADYLKSLL